MTAYTEKRWEPVEFDFKLDALGVKRGSATLGILTPVVPRTMQEDFAKALETPQDYKVFLEGLYQACSEMMGVTSNGNALIDNSIGAVQEQFTENDGDWGDRKLALSVVEQHTAVARARWSA